MSSHYLSDYQPPIIIDVGTDRVKFAQSLLNPQSITKQLRESSKKNSRKDEYDFPLNPNTIFEIDIFMDSFPTLIASSPINCNKKFENTYYVNKYYEQMKINDTIERKIKNYELFNEKLKNEVYEDTKITVDFSFLNNKTFTGNPNDKSTPNNHCGKLENIDLFWGGQIQPTEYDNWRDIISTVGKIKLENHNFLNKTFSETPIIITQKALPYEQLKEQNMKIYEILFEEYKCPYAMISSLGILNAYSQNIESGIVVDMGESGTNITVVKDGFTMYNESIFLPFLSGRITNCFLASYINELTPNTYDIFNNNEAIKNWGKMDLKREISYYDILNAKLFKETDPDFAVLQSQENASYFYEKKLSLESYLLIKKQEIDKPKSLKTEEKVKMNEEMKKIPYKKFHLRTDQNKYFNFQDIENMNCFNYIYFFPEVFKYHMSQSKFNYINIFDFILHKNADSKKFNTRENFELLDKRNLNYKEFNEFTLNYLFSDDYKDSFERKVLKYESDFINLNELNKFRHLSLGHSIIYTIDKLISSDVLNSDKYLNLVCTGGVCNTRNLIKCVNRDIQSLLTIYQDSNKQDYIRMVNTKYDDYGLSFYKGANFISKLPDLENLMISRQQYYDYGSDYLSYCYI